jgi:hypothetical protein
MFHRALRQNVKKYLVVGEIALGEISLGEDPILPTTIVHVVTDQGPML